MSKGMSHFVLVIYSNALASLILLPAAFSSQELCNHWCKIQLSNPCFYSCQLNPSFHFLACCYLQIKKAKVPIPALAPTPTPTAVPVRSPTSAPLYKAPVLAPPPKGPTPLYKPSSSPAPPPKEATPPYKPPAPAPSKAPTPPNKLLKTAAPPYKVLRTPTTPPWNPPSPPSPPVKMIKVADCIPYCRRNCIFSSRTDLCVRRCMPCCNRCKCVPPGTYINRRLANALEYPKGQAQVPLNSPTLSSSSLFTIC
ncbi:hypothetical protein CXB51_001894 [Gossypium anomalum]|uniref:Gibberellin-regulated protein 14 n=1 Tax=Gossypium anomalum TaxID=47600 RepID=A0A8J5ZKN7_9ROSI|nr:hypothetical protein CXB51_001894 [Gossypium anomalum]